MSSIFELGGKPINKDTAMAVSGGTNYEPNYGETQTVVLFKIKPLMPEKPAVNLLEISRMEKEFVGKRRSRLTIIGWFGTGGRWLCRCDCGYYTVRRIAFLKKQDVVDACPECLFVIEKRRQANWLNTGRDSNREDYA